MAQANEIFRHYVVLNARADSRLLPNYFEPGGDKWLVRYIAERVSAAWAADPPFSVAALPSKQVRSSIDRGAPGQPGELVVSLNVAGESAVKKLMAAVEADEDGNVFRGSSPDLPFAVADHWCPRDAADPIFGDRRAAERLMGIDYLKEQNATVQNGRTVDTTGAGVNLVIVDQGLNASQLGGRYGSGWTVGNTQPGKAQPSPGDIHRSHGMMIAHNIQQVARDVTFFDMPLLPRKISDIPVFLSLAQVAFTTMLADIAAYRNGGAQWSGPWILVNPWGIFDTRSEYPRGYYTNNPNNPLNALISGAVNSGIDVIFAAGNCGQFCPDRRCGPADVGPGFGIWGANSLREVLTVGAVRTDAMWLGYSSQGPGQSKLETKKPDLCAASHFSDTNDASSENTGTSTSCAVAAGVVAALRSTWDSATVSPARLKKVLNDTARKPAGLQPGNPLGQRFGNGILDAKAAFANLP